MSTIDVLINLLAKNEELVCRIHKAFAVTVPEISRFWEKMSVDENRHAKILRNLGKKVSEGKMVFNDRKITADDILKMLESHEKTALQVERKGSKQKKPLDIVISVENSILEKNIFDVFEADSPEIKRDFELLHEHTKLHRLRLEKLRQASS